METPIMKKTVFALCLMLSLPAAYAEGNPFDAQLPFFPPHENTYQVEPLDWFVESEERPAMYQPNPYNPVYGIPLYLGVSVSHRHQAEVEKWEKEEYGSAWKDMKDRFSAWFKRKIKGQPEEPKEIPLKHYPFIFPAK